MEKGVALHLNYTLESTLPKNALCQVWLKLVLWFLRSSIGHMVIWKKVYDKDDDNNNEDDGQHTSFDQKSRTELSTQRS